MISYGHDSEKTIFQRVIEKEKFVNGYILSGTEGIGKKLFAIETARSALCQKNKYYEECDCDDCRYVSAGTHPDIFITDTDENSISIDKIRDITANTFMTPTRGKYKFFIINDAHKLTRDASNAFLKTLEEPPDNTVFFLITHLPDHLIDTIKSRCIQMEFSRLSKSELCDILKTKFPNEAESDILLAAENGFGSVLNSMDALGKKVFSQIPPDIFENVTDAVLYFHRIKDKTQLKNAIQGFYRITLDKFKKDNNPLYIDFSNYLMDILHMVEYNLNLDMAKTDIIMKFYGVFGEKN